MLLEFQADTDAAARRLEQMADRVEDSALMDILSDELVQYETDVFATSGHGQWAPLDPTTIAGKGSSRVLVHTGALLEQLTSSSSARVSGDSVVLEGTEYSGYLKAGARGMPKRDPAPAPRGGEPEQWAHQLLNFIVGGAL